MKQIVCEHFSDGWMQLLDHLLKCDYVSPRGLLNREETCVAFKVIDSSKNILVHPMRRMNFRFMVAEWLWYMRGWNDLRELSRFNSQMAAFSDDGLTLAGAYGPRLAPQWPYVMAMFLKDADTRQAVASIWTPNPKPSKDIPCTLSIQFLIRDNKLNIIVTMRSSDIWLGLPYDMFSFSQMQNALAGELQLQRGWIQFNLGSSHLYKPHEEIAAGCLETVESYHTMQSPALPGWILPVSDLPLPKPWNYYNRIVNDSHSSAEALEILEEARRCHDQL